MENDYLVELEATSSRFQSIHRRWLDLGSYNFAGYQFSPPFAGGVFENPEEGRMKLTSPPARGAVARLGRLTSTLDR